MTAPEIQYLIRLNQEGFDTVFDEGYFTIEKDNMIYVNINLLEESSGKVINPLYKLVKANCKDRIDKWESQTTNEAEIPLGSYQYIVNNIYNITKEY